MVVSGKDILIVYFFKILCDLIFLVYLLYWYVWYKDVLLFEEEFVLNKVGVLYGMGFNYEISEYLFVW